jgi:LuxR family transcriptional regulator, maltose regulon positive regulatory protein
MFISNKGIGTSLIYKNLFTLAITFSSTHIKSTDILENMAKGIPILHSKLMAPRTADTVTRDKLRALLSEIPKKKIITVTAGAGYGKTTFIAQAVQGFDTVWYRLDNLDRDLTTFMHHLIEGVRRMYPDFGQEIIKRLDENLNLGLEYKGIITLFIHELHTKLKKDIMIVLDDYHSVQDSPMIRNAVQLLTEHLCTSAHLILISRSEIPLKLSRLRTMREVLDINPEDLLFTTEEIRQFFTQLFGITLTSDSLEILHAKTSGWVSALILFFHSIRQKDLEDIELEVQRLTGSRRLISDYLAENVYARLQPELKQFLIKTSILPRLNALFCNKLLGILNASDILGNLQKSHLFTFVLDEEGQEYYYHQLFQEFLQGVLKRELGNTEKEGLHRDAARILEENGDEEAAVHHYLTAGAYEQACTVLERIRPALINSSRLELMNAYMEKIPEPYFNSHPWIEFIRTIANLFSGRILEGRNGLIKTYSLFSAAQDQVGIDSCLNIMATGLYFKGDFHQAEKIFEELLKSPSLDPILRVEALIHLVFITSQYGKIEESDAHYGNALKFMPEIEDPIIRDAHHAWLMIYHGFRYSIAGNQLKAFELARTAKERLQHIESYRLMPVCFQLSAMACLYQGSCAMGLDEACKGLAISREKGFHDISVGWLLCLAGSNAFGLGRVEEAIDYAEQGLKHFQELSSPFGEAYAYSTLESIYLPMGRLDLAHEMGLACIEAARGLDMPHITAPAKGMLADILILRGNLDDAEVLIKEAKASFQYSTLFELMINRLYTRLFWHRGEKEEALSWGHKCLVLTDKHHYERLAAIDWGWVMPILLELYSRGVMQGCVRKIFTVVGNDARQALMAMQKLVDMPISQAITEILKALPTAIHPGLKVNCLGRFQVFKGKEEIPAENWRSKKAKMLFKLLVHLRSHGYVSKEVFMEHLWPEEDPEKTAKRFHVALTTLRRILEPDLERGQASAYLKTDGDTYLLDLGKDGIVDLDTFEEACRKADGTLDDAQSLRFLLEADRLYTGDFLEEDLYEPWCLQERERVRVLYLSVLASIIDYFMHRREIETAIKYCYSYLNIDAYAEDIYQNLMNLYALSGNKPMVLKTYERCKDKIINDLGCPLSQESELLAENILLG